MLCGTISRNLVKSQLLEELQTKVQRLASEVEELHSKVALLEKIESKGDTTEMVEGARGQAETDALIPVTEALDTSEACALIPVTEHSD